MSSHHKKENKRKQNKKHRVGGNIWNNGYLCLDQFSSVAQSCPTLCDPINHSTPGFPVHHNSRSPPKPMSIDSMMPSNHLILCRSLLLLSSNFHSNRVFSNESALHIRWPKYWSFSCNINLPMNTQD